LSRQAQLIDPRLNLPNDQLTIRNPKFSNV
jgi:hypothetical protein